jgi:uncharacterized protein YjbJ (UPF0337 family)
MPGNAFRVRAGPNDPWTEIPTEDQVNWDRIEGNWKQLKGNIKEKWGKLTDDEFDMIGGKRDKLLGKIQEKYGYTRDEADREVRAWEESYRDEPRH